MLLEVDALDDEGRGVGAHDGRRVHVPGALPGEQIFVILEHLSSHEPRAFGRLLSVNRACASRTAPACPATGRCGGCPLGTQAYEAQLAWKAARLDELASGLAGAPRPAPIHASPRPLGYRGHAKLVYGRAPGARLTSLGAYAARSHELVDLAGCRVVEPVLDEVRAALLVRLHGDEVEPYDEVRGTGRLAYVALRSNAAGDVLVTLVARDIDTLTGLDALADVHPAIAGLCLNERPSGNAIFGRRSRVLRGAAELTERVGPISLYLSSTAFFQVNRAVATALYADLVAALLPAAGLVVDAYAGVGGIALSLAGAGAEVLGIEVNAAAVTDATRAAQEQGLAVRFLARDAAEGLRGLARPIDTLVVNPPRKGLDRAMLEAVLAARPRRLAYVSCDPKTLFRDLRLLAADGLVPTQLRAYDMHPQTAHIETLAICERS